MDKALIQQHLNTIDFNMERLAGLIHHMEDDIKYYKGLVSDETIEDKKQYVAFLKDNLCDLDTIRQEYQKELDK